MSNRHDSTHTSSLTTNNMFKIFGKTNNFRRSVGVSVHNVQKPVQLDPTFDLRKPSQLDPTLDFRNTVQRDPAHDLWKPVQRDPTHDLQKPVQRDPTHDLRNTVQRDPKHDLWKPVQRDPTHDLRKPVQRDPTHDLRKSAKADPKNNFQKPVQVDPTFYLQKPAQIEPSHNLRNPIELDLKHDLRKQVKVIESHDLRWPALQEPDHDLRNAISDTDFFRSEDVDYKLNSIIQAYSKKGLKEKYSKEEHDTVYELFHEDEFLKSNCAQDYWNRDSSISNNGISPENQIIKKKFEYKRLFRESTKACGISFNASTEKSNFKERNSTMWPWMVSVQQYFFGKFWHKCGGSLLNNLWVITAAHCVELRPKWDFLLQLGTEFNDESQQHIERFVDRINIHPKYKSVNFDNDVALLRMDSPVIFRPDIVPICLPWKNDSTEKKTATVLGWQLATKRKVSTDTMQARIVPVLTNKECEVMFSETGSDESIQKSFVCSGTRNFKKDSCIGDSGGPLAVLDVEGRWSLAGLYSWGKTCKIPNQPEVYISVSRYVKWIEDTIACYEYNINLREMD